jgi:hypothetical protein
MRYEEEEEKLTCGVQEEAGIHASARSHQAKPKMPLSDYEW